MLPFLKANKWFVVAFAAVCGICLTLIYNTMNVKRPLPVYQPYMVRGELVDSSLAHKKKYHRIADFSLINQNGKTITQNDYAGKIYVANFFFTTCHGICPIMTSYMALLQKNLLRDNQVMLLSHSVTPEIDSVAQLKRYAIANNVNDKKWNLVTGDKKQIYNLARKSYLAVKTTGDGGPYDMIHTENFVLIDKNRQIRGFYNGTSRKAIDQLLKDIKTLEKEN